MSKKIPTWDLYVDGVEEAVLHGVHKAHVGAIIADLKANGTGYTFVESKAVTPSRHSKKRKDRNQDE